MGTVSKNGSHIHASFSDKLGNTVGGHLKEGFIVDTTTEVCIEVLENYTFDRVYDDNTGYKELIVKKRSN